MNNLFEVHAVSDILSRLNSLQPLNPPLWGKMNVSQMLAHCHAPLEVALGDRQLKRNLLGMVFGGIVKRQMTRPGQLKKNLPTPRSFLVTDVRNFENEKRKLEMLIQRFSTTDPQVIASRAHPFFGKMTVEEWGILQWKHLDHHLRQFGQ